MKVVSFFSGAGGLDLGFQKAGYDIVWANEFDKEIWSTYEFNHPDTVLDRRSIVDVQSKEVPDCEGIIGGPPCQSWSAAGSHKGIDDKRGKLFFDFIRILEDKQPTFFLAENVSGILAPRHSNALKNIISSFEGAGYNVVYKLLNAKDFNVPQDRKRVIFIGYNKNKTNNRVFKFPKINNSVVALEDVIWDLKDNAIPALDKNYSNLDSCNILNHEYFIGSYSTIYMSRNRVRTWEEQSFTIQAGARHAPIHPNAPKMIKLEKDKQIFAPGFENLYRRLSVRECARIQTFPDDFKFIYTKVAAGYKMIGNAVPVNMAYSLAMMVKEDLESMTKLNNERVILRENKIDINL
ncbi:DNA cytosine methyltransferase [uncultured Tenacibaculum sp.]|uniref:DNA cytosine methyltransferase n=1 Tax=uncultured Tenacibaculum sp. TaxID=174713 RepID=UPI00261A0885|nr:DNA cytosine methyltransferase [uncultured Tenacibaculum sp.]